METLPLIFLFWLGLCAGSFALAMTMRMYARKPWVNDRSKCDHCKKVLKWHDLIPLLSWLRTSGKCRYCRKPLSKFYPLVELGTAIIFLLSYAYWPYGFTRMGIAVFALWLVTITLMASLVVFDIKWQLLPDRVTYPLIGLALGSKLFQILYYQDFSRIYGLVLGVVVGAGLFYLLYILSQGTYIGGGDVKLGVFYGILLGSGFKSLLVIALGSTIGTLLILPSIIRRTRKIQSSVPFGPSLILATYLVYIFGDRLVDLLTGTYLFP